MSSAAKRMARNGTGKSVSAQTLAVTPPRPVELDQELPNNRTAERDVLGAIFLDNQALSIAAAKLEVSDFFESQNRHVFHHMIEVANTGQPIDFVTVVESLRRADSVEKAGGAAYVSSLTDGMPRVSNVEHYARLVKEKAVLRNLAYQCEAIKQRALAAGDDTEAIIRGAQQAINDVALSANFSSEPAAWIDAFDTWEDFEFCPPLSFAIGGFLQNNGVTMIGGLSGHGKTLILCSIARALLSGKGAKLWDTFSVEETTVRVMYLIPECAREPFKHRLKLFHIYESLAPNDGRLLVRTLSKGPTPELRDPRILFAAKGAHVILDTAARFSDGDENSANDNARGLANDVFALLAAGARSVIAAHHAPKSFSKETVMTLENALRGTGDLGAMLTTAWGVKQIDESENILHVENIKPRDFRPCGPFQIIGRPFIDSEGDFRIYKRPGECGSLVDEQESEKSAGGASVQAREARAANIELMRGWLRDEPTLNSTALSHRFLKLGIKIGDSAIRKYRKELQL